MKADPAIIQISIQRMVCTACGAEANASCNCGVNYVPKSVRAAEAVMANPEKSDRAIAAEIGISQPTISKVRKQVEAGDKSLSPEKHTGKDGKKYPAKQKPQPEMEDEPEEDAVAELASLREDHVELLVRVNKLEDRNSALTTALNAKEIEASRNWPADMKSKQIKERDKCLGNIAWWQRKLEQLYGEVTGRPSWRVEVATKDGRRLGNGARFGTQGEAEFYNAREAARLEVYATGKVIACENEKANVEVEGGRVLFQHGDCVLFDWRPLGDKS